MSKYDSHISLSDIVQSYNLPLTNDFIENELHITPSEFFTKLSLEKQRNYSAIDTYDNKYYNHDINSAQAPSIIQEPLYYPSTYPNTSLIQHIQHDMDTIIKSLKEIQQNKQKEIIKQEKQEEIVIDPIDELLDF